jgi:uncharacterized protein (TIGR02217 family)
MSNAVYPTLPGVTLEVAKTPEFSTQIQRSVNLSELRASFSEQPVYTFKLQYEVLREGTVHGTAYTELRSLMGFFLARYGSWDSFLFTDPDDYGVTTESLGTGDGATTEFQLTRTFGAFTEDVANVNTIASISVSNTPTSSYTISAGLVTFNSPPASNAPITWSGSYYYRCRFTNDMQEFDKIMQRLFSAGDVEFIGCLGSKI